MDDSLAQVNQIARAHAAEHVWAAGLTSLLAL